MGRPLLVGNDAWSRWLRATMKAVDQVNDHELPAGLDTLLAERAKACAEFFAHNANAFREQQDLIASYDQYGATLQTVLQDYSGDTGSLLRQQGQRYQLAVANMVLHHVPAPQTMFREVANLLAPDGTFLVTDLCRHDQHWAKESCGDLWLGFEPDDLTHWAEEAGLRIGQSQFLGLRNGFQIQFRLFYRT